MSMLSYQKRLYEKRGTIPKDLHPFYRKIPENLQDERCKIEYLVSGKRCNKKRSSFEVKGGRICHSTTCSLHSNILRRFDKIERTSDYTPGTDFEGETIRDKEHSFIKSSPGNYDYPDDSIYEQDNESIHIQPLRPRFLESEDDVCSNSDTESESEEEFESRSKRIRFTTEKKTTKVSKTTEIHSYVETEEFRKLQSSFITMKGEIMSLHQQNRNLFDRFVGLQKKFDEKYQRDSNSPEKVPNNSTMNQMGHLMSNPQFQERVKQSLVTSIQGLLKHICPAFKRDPTMTFSQIKEWFDQEEIRIKEVEKSNYLLKKQNHANHLTIQVQGAELDKRKVRIDKLEREFEKLRSKNEKLEKTEEDRKKKLQDALSML